MGFVGNYAPRGISPQMYGMPVIHANYLKFDPSGVSAEEKPTPTPGNGTNGGSGSQTPTPGNETGGGSNPDEDQTGM